MPGRIPNQQPWRSALRRFAGPTPRWFDELIPGVFPTLQLGRELPDRERVLYNVAVTSDVNEVVGNIPVPTVGITSNVDVRLLFAWAIAYRFPSGTYSHDFPAFQPDIGMGFATQAWNPFDTTFGLVQPQLRPLLAGGAFQPGGTLGVLGSCSIAPPVLSVGFQQQQRRDYEFNSVDLTSFSYAEGVWFDFGPDGLVIPATSILGVSPMTQYIGSAPTGDVFRTQAWFTYRELDAGT